MNYTEYQQYMKIFFEQYYFKLSQDEHGIMLPLDETEKEMWSDDADQKKEWKKWKLVSAAINEKEIEDLEKEIAVKLPFSLRAFLTVYHHYFESPIGRNSLFEHFEAIKMRGIRYLLNTDIYPLHGTKRAIIFDAFG